MATNQQVLDGAWLAFGLEPTYTALPVVADGASLTGPPEAVGSGVDVTDVILALMRVQLRENPAKQRAWIRVETVANSETYTATINTVDHDYLSDADATEAEILAGLKTAIEAGSEPVTCALTTWGGFNVLRVESNSIATFTMTTSATGTAALDMAIEPTSVNFAVWLTPKGKTTPDRADGYEERTITNNWTNRIEIGGFREVYVEITATDGWVFAEVAPCEEQ